MKNEILVILDTLEKDDPAILSMENTIRELLDGKGDLYSIRDNLKDEIHFTNRIHTERQPYYYLYIAVAHLKIGDKKPAKEALAHAVQGFSIAGSTMNEALAEWFFGIIHFEDGKKVRAEQACKRALALLDSLIKDYEIKGVYNHAKGLRKHYNKIEKFTKSINSRLKKMKANPSHPVPQFNIRIPWVDVYDSVQAGVNGFLWSESPESSLASIQSIEIEGKSHSLFPISISEKNVPSRLDLLKKLNYGLAKVRGHSMNASKPVSIEEGDYVLFIKSKWTKNKDAIVIAGSSLTDHETSVMVKKFVAKEKLLVSETTDTSEDYPPIKITEEHQILGTVLAVAKPTS